MRVSELRKRLERYPDDFMVILAKDEEGNRFSPLADEGGGLYVPETTWFGEIRATDEKTPLKKLNAVVLWPTC